MTDADKIAFKQVMTITYDLFRRGDDLDVQTLRYWFSKLSKYDLQTVSGAFDRWIDSQSRMPTPKDIAELCRPLIPVTAALPRPVKTDAAIKQQEALQQIVKSTIKPKRDHKWWAREIIANPIGLPDIAIRFAREALNLDNQQSGSDSKNEMA